MSSRRKRGELRRLVLALLEEHEQHGYGLVCEFQRRGWGTPSPGSIYPLLAHLQRSGFVRSRLDNGRRLYSLAAPAAFAAAPQAQARDREGDERLESAALRLLHAIAQVEEASPTTSGRVRAILDAARRDIYALLAQD